MIGLVGTDLSLSNHECRKCATRLVHPSLPATITDHTSREATLRRPIGNSLDLGQIVGTPKLQTLEANARSMHLHVSGATGTGKSKFLENLLRQDILSWHRSECGLMLLDPHGALYDAILRWLAPLGLDLPIIPVDFRQNEWVVSFNLLRQRARANPAVVVDNVVDAMAFVWGQTGTDQTPLFARWASNAVRALYEKGFTLVDAVHLTDPGAPFVREAMTRDLADAMSAKDWQFANNLSPRDFELQVGSTLNRLGRFVRNEHLKAVLGQPDVSLDLSRALDDGHIILVNLATEGAKISPTNSRLLGTLLLNDLWTAAEERGKSKGKPFYVYIDEFQKFVSPTIAENLDEARGYGLHLTMAQQFPKQLLDEGAAGRRLYNSVMENARSKVVFQLSDEENLLPLAKWLFRGVMDPDQVKLKLYSTKVMDYRLEYQKVYSHSMTVTEGTAEFTGTNEGEAELSGEDAADAWSRFVATSSGETHATSTATTEGSSDVPMLVPQLGKELSSVQFRSLEEQLFRAMAVLFDQEQRQCVVRVVGQKAPVSLFTPEVSDGYATDEWVAECTLAYLRRWKFALPYRTAIRNVLEREKTFERKLLESNPPQEPRSARGKKR